MYNTGIVTLYDSNNYGAFLQAYALSLFLKKKGLKPVFINMNTNKIPEYLFMVKTKNVPLAIFRVRQALKYLKSRSLLNIGTKKSIFYEYDYVFVGSDTLWDVMNNSYPHYDTFLGCNLNAKKIIAYAPSCNMTTAKEFKGVYGERANFDAFDYIGVRDKKTYDLVYEVSQKKSKIVVDPTFLIDGSDYPVENVQIEQKYALIYSYGFSDNEISEVKDYCIKHNLVTLSVGLYNKWCDKNISATVSQFLGLIEKADCIITATFHGTIMSMLNRKRYACFARNNYKIRDILIRTGNERHNASVNPLEVVLAINDESMYNNSFENEIYESKQYITDAIDLYRSDDLKC